MANTFSPRISALKCEKKTAFTLKAICKILSEMLQIGKLLCVLRWLSGINTQNLLLLNKKKKKLNG